MTPLNEFTFDALAALRGSGVQAVGTETGTGLAVGNTDVIKANCIVTVVESGGTLALHLEGSDDDSTYIDIPGGVFLDPSDGEAIDTVGKYEIFIKTALSYIRTVGVVAGDEVTWECFLSAAN